MKGAPLFLLLSVGIAPFIFSRRSAALPIDNNELDMSPMRRLSKDRNSMTGMINPKIQGGLFYRFGIGRPDKADFDVSRILDGSHEIGDPFVPSNDIDPTLRSRRRRQVLYQSPPVPPQQQPSQFQFGTSVQSPSNLQGGPAPTLCIPYLSHTNPLCRQASFGLAGPINPTALLSYYYQNPQLHQPNYQQIQAPQNIQLPGFGAAQGIQIPLPNQFQGQQVAAYQPEPYPPAPQPTLEAGFTPSPEPVFETTPATTSGWDDATMASTTTIIPSTDNPSSPASSDGTWGSSPQEQDDETGEQAQHDPAGLFPDSPIYRPGLPHPLPVPTRAPLTTTYRPTPPPPSTSRPQSNPPPPRYPSQHQAAVEHLNMLKKQQQKEDEIRKLKEQLDQVLLQVAAYEQENQDYKNQYLRVEEARTRLSQRVVQLENTNQHLQEQNGHLQQEITEQRQQINGMKLANKDMQNRLESTQSQMAPLNKQIQMQRQEIEDFIRSLRVKDEHHETCKKQVKLYQLKIHHLMERLTGEQLSDDADPIPLSDDAVTTTVPAPGKETVKTEITDAEVETELKKVDEVLAAIDKKKEESTKVEVTTTTEKVREPAAAKSMPQWETPGGF